jgi:nitrate/nitrite transport system substrate-binding protein
MERTNRRRFLRGALTAGAAGVGAPWLLAGCAKEGASTGQAPATPAAATSGSGTIRLGFIPLTDCASVVMAHELGLYKKHGVDVEVTKEASWANVRDKLLTGELQGAHCLFGMPFSVYTGIGGPAGKELKIAMVLNNNGQAITLSKAFDGQIGFRDVDRVKAAVEALKAKKEPTFAMTFPGGTHDVWLRYWLATAGVDMNTVKIVTIPPPQMVANMKVGNMDGFCVGEPWPGVAVRDGIGFTHLATQDIWKHHPEKALVVNPEFAATRRDDLKKVMMAVLEASIWLDKMENRLQAAKTIGGQAYVNAPSDVIDARLQGKYSLGTSPGEHTYKDDYMLYHRGGAVNFPRRAHGIWFMAQYVRFGYLKSPPDYQKIADTLILHDLYREVAGDMKIAVPGDDMKSFTTGIDQIAFNPADPAAALKRYPKVVA